MEARPCVHVVDDEAEIREALAVTIGMMDLDFASYASGPEFLERCQPPHRGCLIVDLRMPGMSGLELLDVLQQRRIRLPAIVISGHGDIRTAVQAMRAGAVDFLEKPYRLESLRLSVHRAIEAAERLQRKTTWLDAIKTRYDGLSAEERDVMQLTVSGWLDKTIAAKMSISIRTVQLRRAHLMKKMMAESRAELIQMAQALDDSQGERGG